MFESYLRMYRRWLANKNNLRVTVLLKEQFFLNNFLGNGNFTEYRHVITTWYWVVLQIMKTYDSWNTTRVSSSAVREEFGQKEYGTTIVIVIVKSRLLGKNFCGKPSPFSFRFRWGSWSHVFRVDILVQWSPKKGLGTPQECSRKSIGVQEENIFCPVNKWKKFFKKYCLFYLYLMLFDFYFCVCFKIYVIY